MTLCEKERIWEEENKAKGKITSIKPTGGIAFMSLKKKRKGLFLELVRHRQCNVED